MYYGICYYFFEPDLQDSLWLKSKILVNIVVQMEIRIPALINFSDVAAARETTPAARLSTHRETLLPNKTY